MAEQKLPKLLTTAEIRRQSSKTRQLTRVWNQALGNREQNENGVISHPHKLTDKCLAEQRGWLAWAAHSVPAPFGAAS